MFYKDEKFKQKLYNLVHDMEGYNKKMKLLSVDFNKPWWDIILKQKGLGIFVTVIQFVWSVTDSLFPLAVAFAINKSSLLIFALAVGGRFLFTWMYNIMFHYNAIFQIQSMGSVEYEANKFFLTVDPVFHSTKSSGQIISKVNRGSAAYEDFLDVVTMDLLGIVTSLITVIVAMFAFGWQLGLTSLVFILFLASFNIVGNLFRAGIFEPIKNKSEDALKAVTLETLQQTPFIRTNFATTEQMAKVGKAELDEMIKEGVNWQSGTYVNVISRSLYILSFFALGIGVFLKLQGGSLNPTLAIAILLTYSNGTSSILYIGNQMKKLTKSTAAITDLFDFIRGFGKQTYPVLENNLISIDSHKKTIKI
jgi:ABC-type multidrug transport system fused ATPase/permease subunit